ncbi:prepilin-type N-terminal cleavage/methylation domain-containing protein [Cellulomonas carbonis]|uniref:Secretion protein n=1 Tax=Cellulomonas carbonis T26 TaxID=947969 RepID=A0A0A0BQ50_9CELL|nr:prepilin-type N-terminal cleavage/methylation domain-containing protein [Cellulomonas carbonis]KGM10096.1 secretion protein [Cellulomonas carbonis T26]GGB94058.1 hypothetical protein GCM10010972_03420 [Cellulomonas carbonis]
MIARVTKALNDKDKGFTLIELLVVIIIIGILAAIAIPVFLNQREKGWDAAVQSDLKNAATAQETLLTETGAYFDGAVAAANLGAQGFRFSANANYSTGTPAIASIARGTADSDSFCLSATSASGEIWVYDSAAGGIQPTTVNACTP